MSPLPSLFILSLAAVVVSTSLHATDAPAPADGRVSRFLKLDREMLGQNGNFGYSAEEIESYFSAPRELRFDYTGYARQLIQPPPAPGVHPRVLFNSSQLPALRKQLAQSAPGRIQMDGIRATLAALLTGPDAKYAALYDEAAKGQAKAGLAAVEPACAIIYETFRCLIDEDVKGGKKAAAALVTLAQLSDQALDQAFEKNDAKNGRPRLRDYMSYRLQTYSGLLGLGYDFAYNLLNEQQRATVRATLAKATRGMTLIGAETLPALPANTSNWISMHTPLLFLITAIEGEPGYDESTYRRVVAAYQNFLTVGLFPAGEMFESMGKNFLCAPNLIPLANRGENLIALSAVRAQVADYYLHAMDPWGGGTFTFYDSLGGRGNGTPMEDVMAVKRMFPADPAVDFVYRNVTGEDYGFFHGKVRFSHPLFLSSPLLRAVYGSPYDESKTFAQAHDAATQNKPLTYYSDDTGNFITRTDWTPNATVLHLLTRAVAGGHVYADRGHFNLMGLGRHWAIYKPLRQIEAHYAPRNRNVILIDGNGPGFAPSRSAALEDRPLASFAAVDLKPSFDWTTGGNNRFPLGGEPVPFTGNDFRLHKSNLAWMNLPWGDLPNWASSRKGSEIWLRHIGVQRAFRTAGLIRGKHAYALIVDDIQKDQEEHSYDWGMILEDDLAISSTSGDDAVIGETSPAPKADGPARQLLLRVLQAEGRSGAPRLEPFELDNPPMKQKVRLNRLALGVKSVAPDFKVLLFPHRAGEELPRTTWNSDHTRLVVQWNDQKDMIEFNRGEDGRTRLHITRDGANLATVN